MTNDKQRLQHIDESINHIESFCAGITYEAYMEDFKLRLALVKLLEIIGEAATHLSDETKQRFDHVEWATLKAIRNILIHEYFGIDYEIIWDSIQKDIPILAKKINTIVL